jgi:3-oxoadipate enol-lactonase
MQTDLMFLRLGAHLHHVLVEGPADRPVVILVHSLGTSLRVWDAVVAPVTGSLRVVRYDIRGHGLTPPSDPPYSIQELAGDLERLMDGLQIQRATLCGISVGGQIALQAAHDRPGQVENLILCDTSFRIGTSEMWSQRIAAVNEGGLPAISAGVVGRWLTEHYQRANPDATAGCRYMLERCTVAGYVGACAALRDADLESIARATRGRTLVLCGDQDQSTPPEQNRALADAIPGARFELIQGAAHLPCIEKPGAVSAHLVSFTGHYADV